MNSKNVSEPTGEQMTLFSPVGSLNHANHTALQESDLEKKMTATSGRKCLDVFEKFDRNGLWARTYSELLIGTGGWFSTRCNLTWKVKATKYKRMYFQLAPSTPRTEETASGLLPTIRANQVNGCNLNSENLANRNKGNIEETVAKWVTGLLPTPTVMDTNCGDLEKIDQRREKAKQTSKNGNGFGTTIGELANRRLLPTPTANDMKNATLPQSQFNRDGSSIVKSILRAQPDIGKVSLQLNPRFVGEMMGFPPGWTELPFLNGETKASKPTETP